jgi:hypothetical protein
MARIGQITRLRTGSPSIAGVATLNASPPAVINDTWAKISGPYNTGDSRAGPNLNQGWNKVGINTTNGELFAVQGSPSSANFGVFLFSPNTGEWRRTNTITNDWRRGPVATGRFEKFENFDVTYDPIRNVFWRSDGGPFPDPPGSGLYNNYVWSGEVQYNVATDTFRNYWPTFGNAYSPSGSDAGYYNVGGTSGTGSSMSGFESCYQYYNDYVYQYNSYSEGTAQNLKRRNLTTGVVSTLAAYGSAGFPLWKTQNGRMGQHRSGFNSRTQQFWSLADNMAFYVWDESKRTTTGTPSWELRTTSNRPMIVNPSQNPPLIPSELTGDWGIAATIDEAANCLVAWCGRNEITAGSGGQAIRSTHIMDLATGVWRNGPSLAGGQTVPPGAPLVVGSLMYDRSRKRSVLSVMNSDVHEVWALQIAQSGGKITSFPLPARSGSTGGVNYNGLYFISNGDAKHVNFCYNPNNNRLYVSGGDATGRSDWAFGGGSATPGIWSMGLDDGQWRQDNGIPVAGGVNPSPNGYQDGQLFAWMPSRNKMLFGWGSVFPYTTMGYESGVWTFDPNTDLWTQDNSLFPTGDWSKNVYGGVYDSVTDRVYTILDATSIFGSVCRRWDVSTMTTLSSVSIPQASFGTPPGGGITSALFGYGQQVQIGRYIYCPGFWTNGVTGTVSGKVAALWRYNIDTGVFNEVLPRPPNFTRAPHINENKAGVSNGKVCWPYQADPGLYAFGSMTDGMMVYDPGTNTWTRDTKVPNYGNWVGNCVGTIPPCAKFPVGAVVMSGGVPSFGQGAQQQTHIWFYEAA